MNPVLAAAPAPRAQAAVLFGDLSKQGLFALRLKLPAGYSVSPHTHPVDEVVIGPWGLTYVNPEDDPPPKSQ